MARSDSGPYFLIFMGIVGGSSVLYGIWQGFMNLDRGLSVFVGVLAVVASIGLVASGVQLRRMRRSERDADLSIPSVYSILLGVTMIIGAPLALRPWEYTGLASGVSNMIMYVLLGVGGIFTVLGYFWYKDTNNRSPIGVHIGFLAALFGYSISEVSGFVPPVAIILGGMFVFVISLVFPTLFVPEFTVDNQ